MYTQRRVTLWFKKQQIWKKENQNFENPQNMKKTVR